MTKFTFILAFIISTHTLAATVEFAPDCPNICQFSEFENACQGVRFKITTKKKSTYKYTVWNERLNACYAVTIHGVLTADKEKINAQCACPPSNIAPPSQNQKLSEQTKNELLTLRQDIKSWAMCAPDPETIDPIRLTGPYSIEQMRPCTEMAQAGEKGYIVTGNCSAYNKDECTYYGNTNVMAGPYCLLGDMDSCEAIKKSQDPATGAWFRNAYQKRFPDSEQGQPLFSRDELLGVMLYLAKTKDRTAALKWMRFIAKNPKKGLTFVNFIKVFDICPKRPEHRPPTVPADRWEGMQSDDRCELRPDSWGLMYKVYRYIGITHKEMKSISKTMFRKMLANSWTRDVSLPISALTVPAVGGGSYQLALQAKTLLLLRYMKQSNKIFDGSAETFNKRTGYINPYLHWMDQQHQATEYGAYLIKKFCPSERPIIAPLPTGGMGRPEASYFTGAIQYLGGSGPYGYSPLPTGHECIAWIDLYLNGLN